MESFYKRLLLILSLLLLVSTLSFGQGETGQIVGTVADPQNLVVPNATVTLKNVGTSATRTVTTSASGLYTFTMLPPGEYELTATAANFQPLKKRVDVTVGGRHTLDFVLTVTGTQTTVEVVGMTGGTQVETTQQDLSQVVDTQQVTELPTITRNAYSLVGISGNVNDAGTGNHGVGYTINGQRDTSIDVLLDGGENVDLFGAAVGQNIPLDAVSEFRVVTSNFSAEYGRASGGVLNVSSKSGTNAFHGSVYEFWRGAGPTSNTFDNNATMSDAIARGQCASVSDPTCPGQKPNFVRNQFGYSVGGPILKDKLFFFSSTEWIRVRSMGSSSVWVVDPNWIGNCANFSNLAACNRVQSYFAANGTLKPDAKVFNTTTLDNIDYLAVSYPVATDSGGGFPENEYQSIVRFDYNMTDKTQIYGRYALQSQDFFPGANSESPYVGYDTPVDFFGNNILVNVMHIWGPNVVSQSKVVFNRLNQDQPLNGPPVPNLFQLGNQLICPDAYCIEMPGYLPFGPGYAIPFSGPQNLYQFYQDVSWTYGKHQFRFGGQYIHTRDNRVFGAYMNAVEILGGDAGSAAQNFKDGTLFQFQTAVYPQGKYPCYTGPTGLPIVNPACTVDTPLTTPRFDRANRFHDFAFYAQDTWKVHPRFTLNLGVRWEYYGVQHNNDPSWDSNFYRGPGSNYFQQWRNGQAIPSTDPANPVGGLWTPDYNNWAPRIGFAWDIFGDGKTSLRGGYGISYERNFGNVTYNVIQNPPNYEVISLFDGDPGCSPCNVVSNNLGPFGDPIGPIGLPKASMRAVKQDMQTAYAHMWSLSLEREVAKNTIAALEYSGSRGVKLYSMTNPNMIGSGPLFMGDNPALKWSRRINDQYSGMNLRGQQGFSQYNALNVRVQTDNFRNWGLSFVSNYTWSHGIDNVSSTMSEYGNDQNIGLLNPFRPADDKGSASFDIRHRWVFSGTWETPWFKSDSSWWKKNLLGGWTLAPMVTIQSGTPFSLWDCMSAYQVCPRWDAALNPNLPYAAHDVAAPEGPAFGGSNTWDYVVLNPADETWYANPVLGISDFGVCGVGEGAINGCPFPATMTGRNAFRGPGYWNTNLGIYKTFSITERFKVQLRGESFNLMNHSNLYVTSAYADNQLYYGLPGSVLAVRGGTGSGGERRNLQLGIKFLF